MIRFEKTHLATILVLALGLLLGGLTASSQAQVIQERPETGAVNGKIIELDPSGGMFTIQEVGDKKWVFKTNKDTSYMNDAEKIEFSGLKKGWVVVVNYDQTAEGGNLALLVEVQETP